MLATERAVLVRYVRNGQSFVGSGLRIGGRLVLTADHCAQGNDHRVTCADTELPARVLARSYDEDVDLAVLEVPQAEPLDEVGFARVDRTRAEQIRRCQTLGFPLWRMARNGQRRLAQVDGYIPTAEGSPVSTDGVRIGWLALKVSGPVIRNEPIPSGDLTLPRMPWGGISGAAVVTDGLVVGVVHSHNLLAGGGSLEVTPIEAIDLLAPEQRGPLWAALGVSDPAALPTLPRPKPKRSRGANRETWPTIVAKSLAVPVTVTGTLPTVGEVDMYEIGVSDSEYRGSNDPYVERKAFDTAVRQALVRQRFVLVVGPSMAGKSRLVFEAVRHVYPTAALIVPVARAKAKAVATLLSCDEVIAAARCPSVLWLDNLDGYLSPDGLDRAVLRPALRADLQLVIVATMTDERYAELTRPDGPGGLEARLLLRQAGEPIRIDATLTPKQRAEATRLYPDEDFASGVGIGEQLVAAAALRERYYGATAVGCALVRAAADWVRAGLSPPIPQVQLLELARLHLAAIEPTRRARAEIVAAKTNWACQPVASHVSLLRELDVDGDAAYEPHDYVVSFLDGQGPPGHQPVPIPDYCWHQLLSWVSDDELFALGYEASLRRHPLIADAAGRRALQSDDPDVVLLGKFFLGQVAFERGDYRIARNFYENFLLGASDSGADAEYVAKLNLGNVLDALGEPDRASRLFQEMLASGDPDLVDKLKLNLGKLLMDQGHYEAATSYFSEVVAGSDQQARVGAHGNLAFIAVMQDADPRRAQPHLEVALESGVPSIQALARNLCGKIALDDSDFETAEAEFRQAMELGESTPTILAVAQANLGEIRWHLGDETGAREFLQAAIESGLPSGVLPAKLTLAQMEMEVDDELAYELLTEVMRGSDQQFALRARLYRLILRDVTDETLAELTELSRSEILSVAHYAELVLGLALAGQDKLSAAQQWLERAASSPLRRVRTNALVFLGDLVAATDSPAAERHWRQALDQHDTMWSAEAAIRLAKQARLAGDIDTATELYRQAADTGHPTVAARATDLWGDLLYENGDIDGARERYRQAIASNDARWSSKARLDLAVLELETDGLSAAEALLWEVIDGGVPVDATWARHLLADALLAAGSVEQAAAFYTAVLEVATGRQALMVQADLGYALLVIGDIEAAERHLAAVIAADDPAVSLLAQVNLGVLRLNMGRNDEATELFQTALAGGHSKAAALAALNIAASLGDAGQHREAREHLDMAVASGHIDAVTERLRLVQLANAAGELTEAERLARDSLDDVGEPQRSALLFQLGLTLRQQGRTEDAMAAFVELTDVEDATLRAGAWNHLGDLLRERGDKRGARERYQQAIDSGHPLWSAQATIDLADMLIDDGEAGAARNLLKRLLTQNPPPAQSAQAKELLARKG